MELFASILFWLLSVVMMTGLYVLITQVSLTGKLAGICLCQCAALGLCAGMLTGGIVAALFFLAAACVCVLTGVLGLRLAARISAVYGTADERLLHAGGKR